MRPRFLAALLALVPLAACTTTVTVDPDEEECGPKPGGGGWCPPAWQCVDGEWVDTAGMCPEPACPASVPANGDSCPIVGQDCSYTVEEMCGPVSTVSAVCTATGWKLAYSACQPEPTCPLQMPVVGSDCSGWDYPYFCQYNHACIDVITTVAMSCDYTVDPPSWQLDSEPPLCAACESMGDAASCSATSGCQWLVPGCGENPIAEGCYPAGDCQVDGCDIPEQSCVVFDKNPCWNELCDACNAPIGVCLWINDG